jgi:hypothetical protein
VRQFNPAKADRLLAAEPFDRGGIIGKVEIVNCMVKHPSQWFMGPYGFLLRNPEPLPFHPYKGSLGFFDVDYPNIEP